jgi:hypothetical protein
MTEDCTRSLARLRGGDPELVKAGWEGTLSSEYEGNRWIQDVSPVDSREQVRRQHVMFERLIAKAEAEFA